MLIANKKLEAKTFSKEISIQTNKTMDFDLDCYFD